MSYIEERASLDYDTDDGFDLDPPPSDDDDDDGGLFSRNYDDEKDEEPLERTPPRPAYIEEKVPGDHVFDSGDGNVEKRYAQSIIHFESLGIYGTAFLIGLTTTILISMGNFTWLPMIELLFVIYIILFFGIFFAVALIGGILVVHHGVNVMYTRKFIHVFSFILPFTLFYLIPFDKTVTTYSLTCCCLFLAYLPLVEPIRVNKGFRKIFYYSFVSFDRPQDPFTLLWAVSQSFCAFMVMLPIGVILASLLHAKSFVSIPIMTVAFGDGFAEIVGRNWGAHKFKTNAMCTYKEYTRSVEGSLCVYVSCLLTILIVTVYDSPGTWNALQIIIACIFLPPIMTVIEAIAPHSWDNAILLAVGGALTILIFAIPGGAPLYNSDEDITVADVHTNFTYESIGTERVLLNKN